MPLKLSFFVLLKDFLCSMVEDLIIVLNFPVVPYCWLILLHCSLAQFSLLLTKDLSFHLCLGQL